MHHDDVPDVQSADIPEHCETCGTRLETGMVEISESQIDNDPALPSTTVFEAFCPNPDCPAHKPQQHETDGPTQLGGQA